MIEKITFGKDRNYKWEHISIDEGNGYPILIDGKIVGGVLPVEDIGNGLKFTSILGIEILPEFRKNGIAKKIVMDIIESSDLVRGAIVDNSVEFWKKCGAETMELPKVFTRFPDVKIEKPLLFWITRDKELSKEFRNRSEIGFSIFKNL